MRKENKGMFKELLRELVKMRKEPEKRMTILKKSLNWINEEQKYNSYKSMIDRTKHK